MNHRLRGKSPRPLFRRLAAACCFATALLLSHPAASTAQDTILHDFSGFPDGSAPYGSLTLSGTGSTLYGMTYTGGGDNDGTIFSMSPDGSNFNTFYNFTDAIGDGSHPLGSLTLSGSTLYGTTYYGGGSDGGDVGAIFSIGTDGSHFTLLHGFPPNESQGAFPTGSLIISGSTIYGLTSSGGSGNDGAAFSMNLNGSGFTLLHSFTGGPTDGKSPTGSLLLSGSKLYGLTPFGGSDSNDYGTAYTMNLDGSGYTVLHLFDNTNGLHPRGTLIQVGSKLYGTTEGGGTTGFGTIFSMNLDGSGFQVVYQFPSSGLDGAGPEGSLIASGNKLFGTASYGGNGDGVAFSVNSDGSGFTLLQDFTGQTADGSGPEADLTLSVNGQALYGMTYSGGANNDGVIFSVPSSVPEPAGISLLTLGAALSVIYRRR